MSEWLTNPRPNRFSWATLIVITLFVGAVVTPVASEVVPTEVSKWKLAAADNAIDADDLQRANKLLDEAIAWDDRIQQEQLFKTLQLKSKGPITDQQIEYLWIEHIRQLNENLRKQLIEQGTQEFLVLREFSRLVHFAKAVYPEFSKRSAGDRNNLSYFRALSGMELDDALVEIDLALIATTEPEVRSVYLDTKAWVLFRLGNYAEARTAIDEAIEFFERAVDPHVWSKILEAGRNSKLAKDKPAADKPNENKNQQDNQPSGASAKESLKERIARFRSVREFEELSGREAAALFSMVVYRYHRAKILEGLEETELANQDYQWLKDLGYEPKDYEYLY